MGNATEVAMKNSTATDTCVHYWLIETPSGPTSRGVCRFCGAEKDFYNSDLDPLADTDDFDPGCEPSWPCASPN